MQKSAAFSVSTVLSSTSRKPGINQRISSCKNFCLYTCGSSVAWISSNENKVTESASRRSVSSAAIPLSPWIKRQLCSDSMKYVSSCAGTAAAFVLTLALSAAIATVFTLVRFYLRNRRRQEAQAKRASERLLWVKHRVQRALVLGLCTEKWRREQDFLAAMKILSSTDLVQGHADSLASAEIASECLEMPNSRHVLSVCFRSSNVDNWRLKATGDALFNTVHRQGESRIPELVTSESIQDSSKWGLPGMTFAYSSTDAADDLVPAEDCDASLELCFPG